MVCPLFHSCDTIQIVREINYPAPSLLLLLAPFVVDPPWAPGLRRKFLWVGCGSEVVENTASETPASSLSRKIMLDLELERTDPINWKLSETVGLFALKDLKSILLKLNDAGHRAEKIKQSFCIIIYIFTYLYKVSIQIIFYCWEKWFLIIRLPSLHFFN